MGGCSYDDGQHDAQDHEGNEADNGRHIEVEGDAALLPSLGIVSSVIGISSLRGKEGGEGGGGGSEEWLHSRMTTHTHTLTRIPAPLNNTTCDKKHHGPHILPTQLFTCAAGNLI